MARAAKKTSRPVPKTYTLSLAHRKPRGTGHERLSEILAAAKKLFLEHGVENVSTRQIAKEVGISQPALFSYYRTRDDILRQLVRDAFAELGKGLDRVNRTATDPVDWIKRAISEYIAFGLKHPDEYRLAFMVKSYRKPYNSAAPEKGEKTHAIGLDVFLNFERGFAEALRNHALRKELRSSMAVAQAVWASIHGLVSLLIAYPGFPWENRERLIQLHIDMLLRGLGANH